MNEQEIEVLMKQVQGLIDDQRVHEKQSRHLYKMAFAELKLAKNAKRERKNIEKFLKKLDQPATTAIAK